ncbi:AEC family transporter [Clostridium sp.]|uniref:AEC family transporter n=1 Tax=Clostridium sp. TaxID=1506 RepID=UPI0025BDDBA4|nr:AEC family transporter [Clostridium sp.]
MIVFNKVIALFLIILIGVYGTKKNIINADVNKGLRRILLEITLPLLVINSFSFSFDEGMGKNIIIAFIYSIVFMILGGIISFILLKPLKGERKKILHFANVFSNCGFIGFPIINSIFGAEGVVYTSIFNIVFTIFLWTYGVMIFSDKLSKENIKKVLVNPSIIAVCIGIPIMIFNIKLPVAILDTTKIVGDMTAPISMIIVGSILSKVKIKSIFKEASVYYGALIKLIVIPLAIYIVKLIIKDNSNVIDTIIIIQAMPAAAMTSIFAADFDKEKEYGAIVVFVTTLLSILTIPIMVRIIGL